MAKMALKRRGGGKGKTLFSTPSVGTGLIFTACDGNQLGNDPKSWAGIHDVTYSLVGSYEEQSKEQEEERKAFTAQAKTDLKAYLAEAEKGAKAILTAYYLPTIRREILPYTKEHDDLPPAVGGAAEILCSILEVREYIKKGDVHSAAYEALRIGTYIARNNAEAEYGGRKSSGTSEARKKKEEKAKERRARMKVLAIELFDWKPGEFLNKTQRKEVNKILLSECKAIDRPTTSDMSNDALKIGLRKKKSA